MLLADLILVVHFLFVLFVVVGLALIWIGAFAGWAWVRNPWFRIAHACAIGYVAFEAIAGIDCPLTVWENDLRRQAGGAAYEAGFIDYWLHTIMYFRAPAWIFTVGYLSFAALVLGSLVFVRPTRPTLPRRRVPNGARVR